LTPGDDATTIVSMLRALVVAAIVLIPRTAPGQAPGRLHIRVALTDAAGTPTPVARHPLLVSAIPPSDVPRRLVTAPDGTAALNLLPGSYMVESDRPLPFQGRTYRWMQVVDIVAGREARLELTTTNAVPGPGTPPSTTATESPPAADPATLLLQWRTSVVTLWTPTVRASGFVVDRRGLVATSQRVVGQATAVEVQLTPALKVAGRVLAADPERDVALVWIDPAAIASVTPVPLPCTLPAVAPLVLGDELVAIGPAPARQDELSFGAVHRVTSGMIVADFGPAGASPGGPVFAEDGHVVGLTSVVDGGERQRGDVRIVRAERACDVVRSAQGALNDGAPPNGTPLPVEPTTPYPLDALRSAVGRRAGSLRPYVMSSSNFDIAFMTPVLVYAAQQDTSRPSMDFSNWSEYVRDAPPVLLVRVTPKQVESFWMTLARGAAWTQGTALPPITHLSAGFSRLQAFCGQTEVTPIHPFKLELRVSETEAVYEGLSVFAPDALGPHCGTVRLLLYSEQDPERGDSRNVDPKIVRQIWQDFEPYRAVN
jgi:hypothetical protein